MRRLQAFDVAQLAAINVCQSSPLLEEPVQTSQLHSPDGCLNVASSRGWVFALNADTGGLVWKAKVPKGGSNSTVAVRGGRVIVAVSNDDAPYVIALSQKTGAT